MNFFFGGGVTFFHLHSYGMTYSREYWRTFSHDVCITSLFTPICKIIATVVFCLETGLVRFHMSLLGWLLCPDAAKVVWSKTHPIIENHMQQRQWEMILVYLIQQWDGTAALDNGKGGESEIGFSLVTFTRMDIPADKMFAPFKVIEFSILLTWLGKVINHSF